MHTCYALTPHHRLHTRSGHPESRQRLEAVGSMLEESGLADELDRLEARPATFEQLELVHFDTYLEQLRTISDQGGGELDPDTYATGSSWEVLREAAGAALAVTDAVCSGQAENGFALTRPPGHHAKPGSAMGFCLVNHAAVAAAHARQRHGLDRVMIVDFDVHHGNGTQEIFYQDAEVLYGSVHQSPLFPGTGSADEIGVGPGEWRTVNVPVPEQTGDEGYLAAHREVLRPAAEQFEPELLVLSAGYDAHWKDPIGGLHLTVDGFARCVSEIADWAETWCDGRLVTILEGGYHTEALAAAVRATLERLRDPEVAVDDPFGAPPEPDRPIDDLLRDVRALHGWIEGSV